MSVTDLCTEFKCNGIKTLIRQALEAYKRQFWASLHEDRRQDADFSRPVFALAALYMTAEKHKHIVQVPAKNDLLKAGDVKEDEFKRIYENMKFLAHQALIDRAKEATAAAEAAAAASKAAAATERATAEVAAALLQQDYEAAAAAEEEIAGPAIATGGAESALSHGHIFGAISAPSAEDAAAAAAAPVFGVRNNTEKADEGVLSAKKGEERTACDSEEIETQEEEREQAGQVLEEVRKSPRRRGSDCKDGNRGRVRVRQENTGEDCEVVADSHETIDEVAEVEQIGPARKKTRAAEHVEQIEETKEATQEGEQEGLQDGKTKKESVEHGAPKARKTEEVVLQKGGQQTEEEKRENETPEESLKEGGEGGERELATPARGHIGAAASSKIVSGKNTVRKVDARRPMPSAVCKVSCHIRTHSHGM